jgi:signal transduction histidine kinase
MAGHIERLLANERRLLEDISHELRAPLSRLTFAVLLARTAPDSKIALDRVERDVNRITALVSEIVEMTRLEGDPTYFKMETVKIQEVIEETVSDSQLEAGFQGCAIQLVGQLSCEVSGDRELLRRAIENVLRNAIRYSPERSKVDVTLGYTEGVATISIRDYGPGVPQHSLTEIFEPFFRVEEARETGLGGIGLGLSIAKRAVQLHHGTIVAENAFPGLQVHIKIPFIVSQ